MTEGVTRFTARHTHVLVNALRATSRVYVLQTTIPVHNPTSIQDYPAAVGTIPLLSHAAVGTIPLLSHAAVGTIPLLSHAAVGTIPLLSHAAVGTIPLLSHAAVGTIPLLSHAAVGTNTCCHISSRFLSWLTDGEGQPSEADFQLSYASKLVRTRRNPADLLPFLDDVKITISHITA